MSKQAIFLVTDSGGDGRARASIIYASTDEVERDDWHKNHENKNYYTCIDEVHDLDEVAKKAWKKLNGLEKLSLERTDCPIWTQIVEARELPSIVLT